ncbi:MAG: DNA-binding response regulator [Phycisphaeraceae bacterium]|nr:DNA-binding response regulator [Phycisphaeraceae bacterium]
MPTPTETHPKAIKPTVFVVDDDAAVRESMAWLIESHGYEVQIFDSAQTFLDVYQPYMTGCIVLDVRMPGMDGLQLQNLLHERGCTLPTIFVTGHAEVPIAIAAIRSGGFDFLEKPFDDDVMLERIRQALALEAQSRDDPDRHQDVINRITRLTPQEKRIMQMICQGMTNRQIADDLELSHKTIEVYRTRVMQKMQASSLPTLVRMLVENGLG